MVDVFVIVDGHVGAVDSEEDVNVGVGVIVGGVAVVAVIDVAVVAAVVDFTYAVIVEYDVDVNITEAANIVADVAVVEVAVAVAVVVFLLSPMTNDGNKRR